MVRRLAIALIDLYRRWLSPILPPSCRFYPSCSAYARESYIRHGVFAGSWLTAARLLKCHPFHSGGVDPVPATFHFCGCGRDDAKGIIK